MTKPKIKNVIILVELEGGGVHQVSINRATEGQILEVISCFEASIKIIDKPIDGIYVDTNN